MRGRSAARDGTAPRKPWAGSLQKAKKPLVGQKRDGRSLLGVGISLEGPQNTLKTACRPHLEGYGAVPLSVRVLGDVEPHQVLRGQSVAGDRVLLVLSHVRHDVEDVEDDTLLGAHRCLFPKTALRRAGARARGRREAGREHRHLFAWRVIFMVDQCAVSPLGKGSATRPTGHTIHSRELGSSLVVRVNSQRNSPAGLHLVHGATVVFQAG